MNENGGKSSTILLTVIGIATLLVVVVGATFAYFAAQVNGDRAASVTIQAASDGTSVAIGGTEAETLTGIYPKEEPWLTKEVTLNVPGTTGSTTVAGYSFDLVVSENNYNSDGTIKSKGNRKVKWIKSNHYIKNQKNSIPNCFQKPFRQI